MASVPLWYRSGMSFRRYVPNGARFRTTSKRRDNHENVSHLSHVAFAYYSESDSSSFIIMSLCCSSLRIGSFLSSLHPLTLRLTSNLHIHSQPSTHPCRTFSSSMPLRTLMQPVFSPEAIHRVFPSQASSERLRDNKAATGCKPGDGYYCCTVDS